MSVLLGPLKGENYNGHRRQLHSKSRSNMKYWRTAMNGEDCGPRALHTNCGPKNLFDSALHSLRPQMELCSIGLHSQHLKST